MRFFILSLPIIFLFQAEQLKVFVAASNERIQQFETELVAIKNTKPYDQMTEEEWAFAHPEWALDCLNNPSFAPHTPEAQLDAEDLAFYRGNGFIVYPGPDKFLEKRK